MKILQDVSTLPDMYKQTVLDLITSLKALKSQQDVSLKDLSVSERRIGSRKGVKFLASACYVRKEELKEQ